MKLRFAAASLFVASLSVAGAAAAPASSTAPGQTASLHDLVRGWTRPMPQLPARANAAPGSGTRADALAALSGGRGSESGCVTPLLIALYQNAPSLNQPTRLLLDQLIRVPTWGGATKMSAGGEFRIHYWTDPQSADRVESQDDDLDGVPDGVERLASEFTDELANFVHKLNWAPAQAPIAPGGTSGASDGVVDVYLIGSMGPKDAVKGFVMPKGPGWPASGVPLEDMAGLTDKPEATDAAIYLDARLASASSTSRDAVAHMVAHMVLMRESVRESPWWHEASASWLEDRLVRDAGRIAARFSDAAAGKPARATRGVSDDMLGMSMEGFLWPHYLIQSTASDATLLRRLWEEMGAVPGNNTFEAMDRVLRRVLGTSLAEEIRVFNIWNIFLGKADDGGHYPFAALLPTPQGDASYEVFPARGPSPAGPVPPLGFSMLRILGDGSQGGLRIRFFGSDPGAWDVSLISYSAGRNADVRHVPVEIDSSGRGFIPVPWKNLAAMDLMVQNLASPGTSPADYYFSVEYDPAVPYDLLNFSADGSIDGATLSWSTDNEERLAGWNIWRGAGPLGPFSRLNRYMVPGAGLAGQPLSYMYVDSSVQPGRKYYYYLEGVTLDGFAENTHPAGVRIEKPAGSRSTPR